MIGIRGEAANPTICQSLSQWLLNINSGYTYWSKKFRGFSGEMAGNLKTSIFSVFILCSVSVTIIIQQPLGQDTAYSGIRGFAANPNDSIFCQKNNSLTFDLIKHEELKV